MTQSILHEAHGLVHGDRGMMYGHPLDDMGRTAGMLTHLLSDKLRPGAKLTARDVAMVMICVKLSRERNHPKRDNRVDGAGYWECLDEIVEETKRRESPQLPIIFNPSVSEGAVPAPGYKTPIYGATGMRTKE